MTEWYPIETAPRNGDPIIVARDIGPPWGFVMGLGFYDDTHGVCGWAWKGFANPPGSLGPGRPTYWTNLPEPPERKQFVLTQSGEAV